MRVAVLGAGSIGCFVGGAWQAAGVDVRFVGRPTIGKDIAAHGLTLTDQDGWEHHFAPGYVAYSTDPASLVDADLIALAVKSGATAESAAQIRAHARPGTTVLSLQNGVSNIDTLKSALGTDLPVVQGMVPFNVAYLGDGHFHKGVAGQLMAEDVPVMCDLAAQIGPSPAGFILSNDMLGVAWGKLLVNLNNAVNALSGRPLKAQLAERDYRRVMAATLREGLAILDAAGIVPAKVGAVGPRLLPLAMGSPDWLFRTLIMRKWKIDDRARSSMADDLAQGRKTEIDYLNGEIITLADRLGIAAPVNAAIVALVRQAEAGGRHDWSPAELRKAVLA